MCIEDKQYKVAFPNEGESEQPSLWKCCKHSGGLIRCSFVVALIIMILICTTINWFKFIGCITIFYSFMLNNYYIPSNQSRPRRIWLPTLTNVFIDVINPCTSISPWLVELKDGVPSAMVTLMCGAPIILVFKHCASFVGYHGHVASYIHNDIACLTIIVPTFSSDITLNSYSILIQISSIASDD